MNARFLIVDVFTRRPFGGNQLAVFPDAEGLPAATMQALAREFNFAETTFVLPPSDPSHAARVRIFTPGAEVPFAGHPTIGTTAVLASLGRLAAAGGRAAASLELGIGPVAVEADLNGGQPVTRLTLEPRLELPGGAPPVAGVAAALSLAPTQVHESVFAGVGLPFCLVRLADRAEVDQATLDRSAWAKEFAGAWSNNLFLYAGNPGTDGRLYARMFAPALGIEEDPATGSAAAALAALAAHRAAERDGSFRWEVEQGVRMGRPSLIEAEAEKRDGRVVSVSLGGASVVVGEGEMKVA